MTDCTRRDWLRLISAAGLTIGATHLSADDGHQVSTSTVHDDIREELDAAPLSLRFRGRSRTEFEAWQVEFRDTLKRLLGNSTPPKEWAEISESRVELDDHTRLELLLRAPGAPDLPVYLLLPRGASADSPVPGMLCLHGHGDHGHPDHAAVSAVLRLFPDALCDLEGHHLRQP